MRRALAWLVGLLLLLVVVAFLVPFVASEAGEVLVLHTTTPEGESTTRLWVVEHDGDQWLRSGGGESGWSHRIAANPQVRIERNGRTLSCLAEVDLAERDRINALMAEHYGWSDRVLGLFVGDREAAIPVRLRCTPA